MSTPGRIERDIPTHPFLRRDILWIASIALVYFAMARLSLLLVFKPEGIAAIWPPTGIFLSAILLTRRDLRPWLVGTLLITDFIAEMLTGTPWMVSLIYALILTGDAVLSSWLLVHFVGEPITFRRVREVVVWLLLSVIFSNAVASLLAALTASQFLPGSPFWTSLKLWLASDGIGNLVFTPLILSWAASGWAQLRSRNPNPLLEAAALFILLAIVNAIAFDRLSEYGPFSLLLPYLTFPFLLWAALRFGVPGVTGTTFIMASVAIYFASIGHITALAQGSQLDVVIMVQVYLAIMAVPALFLATVVTERRQVEESLRDSEDKFKYVFDYSNIGKSITMPTGEFHANKTFIEMIGYSEKELQDKKWQDITHPDDVELTQREVDTLLSGEKDAVRFIKRYIKKDGTILWIDLSSSMRRDEDSKPLYMMTSLVDITERKKMEKALQDSERGLVEAQNLANIGSWEYDIATDKATWSRKMFDLFGRDPALGEPSWQEHRTSIHPDDWETLDKAVTSREPYNIEFRLLHPVRGIRWAQTIGQVERDGSGEIVKLKGTVQDITERKNAEEEIKQLNQNLETKVEERTSQLANANKELESFSYSVSHDLRAPLRALDGFSLAVLEDYESKLDDTGRNYLNRIREASQKMSQLIDAMLILSRVTKAKINRGNINLSNLAENIAVELTTHDPRRNVTWKIAPDLNAMADATLIKSVMENLLGNAWKFTSRHPCCIIEVGKIMQNGNEVFYVKDDGAGFDMKYISKMFAPFQRLHSISEFEGTGIGLATVNRIINKHGGRIWAEAEPEKGATFYFTLG